MLKEKLNKDLVNEIKSKNSDNVAILRRLLTKITEKEKGKKSDGCNDDDVLVIINKTIKERQKGIEFAEQAGRNDVIKSETYEIEYLTTYLPKQMSENDIKDIITKLISENSYNSVKDLGKIMGYFGKKYKGKVDNGLVSKLAKEMLI